MPEAEEIMLEPDFIEYDADVEDVAEEFSGTENTLIVKKDDEAIGEIHENSMLKVLIPEERLDEEKVVGLLGLSFDSSYTPEKAEDLMNKHEVKVKPEDDLGEVAFLMHREEIRSVPVMEDGEVIGVVHEDTMMDYL